MKKRILLTVLFTLASATLVRPQTQSAVNNGAPVYGAVPNWLKQPEWRKETRGWDSTNEIGSMHGDIAVSAAGDVYFSVEGTARQRLAALGPGPGLQVYKSDGAFLRNVPNAPYDLHGFIIHSEQAGEFIYGARLGTGITETEQARISEQVVVKMTLDGKVVMAIPASRIPDRFKNKTPEGRAYTRLTGLTVAPNGDIYVTDGYASSYIHRFDRQGTYLQSFGGSAAPCGFRTLHKLTVDTRFTPPRLIACDRANNRVVHLSMTGELLGVVAEGLRLPAAIAVRGDYAAVGELQGRAVVLDKSGKIVTTISANDVADEIQSNATEPVKWRPGVVTAPHGIAFNADGDIFISEFNLYGRVHRFNLSRGPITRAGSR